MQGLVWRRGKCYRVAKLFDECDTRREMLSYEAAKLYRGQWLGDCTIMYETLPELCRPQKS